MAEISSSLLYAAFIIYFIATAVFAVALTDKKADKGESMSKWGRWGYILSIVGFLSQLGYFITRWIASGHAPVSNLFEFTTFFGMMMVLGFIVIYAIYRLNVLGVFAMPIALLIIAYASMFPREIEPLIPALQSNWLKIHVTTAALGEGILAISFVAGLIYLIATIDQSKGSKKTGWLEFVLYTLLSTLGFILVSISFGLMDYQTTFEWVNENDTKAELVYEMPAIAGPMKARC